MFVALLAFFVAILPSVFASTSRAALFSAFQTTYNKAFTPDAEQSRFEAFCASLNRTAKLNEENQNAGGIAVFGVNRFSDLTPEEFEATYLTYKPPASQVPSSDGVTARAATITLASVDWRNINGVSYISPVRDQDKCGSCWAFSALAAIESWQMMAGIYTQQLSVQQVTSCDVGRSTGCVEGYTEDAFDYIIKYGVTTEAAYPWVSGPDAVTRSCLFPSWAPPTSSSRRLLGVSTPTTKAPTAHPSTKTPTAKPTTKTPTPKPTTKTPTQKPTKPPTIAPTTKSPTSKPTTKTPTPKPSTRSPTSKPTTLGNTLTAPPTAHPTTKSPTAKPTTKTPTQKPTIPPTKAPTTKSPVYQPTTKAPTAKPTTRAPTGKPTTKQPTGQPTHTLFPTRQGYPIIASATAWKYVTKTEASLLQALQPPPSNPNGGPVSICLAGTSLQDYVSGILKVCTGGINHCLQLVGYGTESGTDYWTLKNQWGTDWGEGGYARIQRGVNLCKVASGSMIYPVGVSAG